MRQGFISTVARGWAGQGQPRCSRTVKTLGRSYGPLTRRDYSAASSKMKINNSPAVSSSVRTKEVTKRAPRGLGKRKAEAEALAAPQLIGSEMAGDMTTAVSATVPVATVGQNEALRSVVRLEVAAAEPDYSLPWQKGDPYYTSGSACVIESPPGTWACVSRMSRVALRVLTWTCRAAQGSSES